MARDCSQAKSPRTSDLEGSIPFFQAILVRKDNNSLRFSHIPAWLVYPALYLVYSLIRGGFAATSWVLSIALIFTDRTKGPSHRPTRYSIDSPLIFCRQSLSDLEGRSRSTSRALRPVLMAARRIEPFLRTGLPFLPRRTTKNLFETRGCYPDDK
jgi:hypothetical protein